MISLSEQIRHDMDIINGKIDEGTLRNFGMAAAVAGGLMAHQPAHAQAYSATVSSPPVLNMGYGVNTGFQHKVAMWWSALRPEVKTHVTDFCGRADDYIANFHKSHPSSTATDAEILNKWLTRAYGVAQSYEVGK